MICEHCGQVGQPRKLKAGSTAVGVILLLMGLLFLVLLWPIGLVLLLAWAGYNVWRLMSKREVCPSCKRRDTMLSAESPRGRKLMADFGLHQAAPDPGLKIARQDR